MTITSQQIDAWDDAVDAAYEAGRQEGMKQERALWTLTKLGQEIEAQPKPEPVAWMNKHGACINAVFKKVEETAGEYTTPLYTALHLQHEPT